MTCTFFGHRDTPDRAENILRETIIDLIENENVNLFYVGNVNNIGKSNDFFNLPKRKA